MEPALSMNLDKLITETYPPIPLQTLANMVNSFPTATRGEKKSIIDELVSRHAVIQYSIGSGSIFHRTRAISSEPSKMYAQDALWRKNYTPSKGRANSPDTSVMYASHDIETSLSEIYHHAPWGDHHQEILVSGLKIIEGAEVRVIPIGEMGYLARTGFSFMFGEMDVLRGMINACPLDDIRSLTITDDFLGHCFSEDENYDISSYVAEKLFQKSPDSSAICYTSKRRPGGKNIAIRTSDFWNNWSIVSISKMRVEHLWRHFFKLRDITSMSSLTHENEIVWNDASEPVERFRVNVPGIVLSDISPG